jgi:chaperone required for assembly of F1-ATPase
MPLTRIANSAIDAVSARMAEVVGDVVAFSGSDLLCYRAESPETLVRRQASAWDPVLAWAREELEAEFKLQKGLMPIEQPPEALQAIGRALGSLDALSLAALPGTSVSRRGMGRGNRGRDVAARAVGL